MSGEFRCWSAAEAAMVPRRAAVDSFLLGVIGSFGGAGVIELPTAPGKAGRLLALLDNGYTAAILDNVAATVDIPVPAYMPETERTSLEVFRFLGVRPPGDIGMGLWRSPPILLPAWRAWRSKQ